MPRKDSRKNHLRSRPKAVVGVTWHTPRPHALATLVAGEGEGAMSSPKEPAGREVESPKALVQQIEQFFGGVAGNLREKQLCNRCGKEMGWMDTTFSLYGTDSVWRVRVPVCGCKVEGRAPESDEGSAIERLAS
jgi:hypothetical protein